MSDSTEFSGLSCEFHAPFSWEITDALEPGVLALIDKDNYSRLQIIQGFEESSETLEDVPGLAQELHRIDFKVNVLLELVSHVVTKDNPFPLAHTLILGCNGIQWTTRQQTPAVGDRVKMELFLERRFPFPLVLVGHVDSVADHEDGAKVIANFKLDEDFLQELWEKFIFRCHRRHVARLRRDGKQKGFI